MSAWADIARRAAPMAAPVAAPGSVVVAAPLGLSLALADGTRISDPPLDARRPYHPLHPELPQLHLCLDATPPSLFTSGPGSHVQL